MDKKNVSLALTSGLLAGYGGQTKFTKTTRDTFEITSSRFEDKDIVYHDEWTSGGGQEIVKVGDEMFTRVYAGGAIGDTSIIIPKLIYFIQELREKTRLFSNCSLVFDDWSYEYRIIDVDKIIDVTTGKKTIYFQGNPVFVHVFVLSPTK